MATKKSSSKKKTTKKSSKKLSARVPTGTVPPYGEVIRGAIARGDAQGMRNAATSARKWIAEVQKALAELDSAMKK